MLINEGVSGSLQAYYECIEENDPCARAGASFTPGTSDGANREGTYHGETSGTIGKYLYNMSNKGRFG